MRFCPDCRQAYRDEIERCPECNLELVASLVDYKDIEFVELTDVDGPFQAELILDVMKDNDIECYLYTDTVHIYPVPGEGIQYTIFINKEKIEQAKSLLVDIEKGEQMEPLPGDEST